MSLAAAYPKQARAMDKRDIRELRRWHRAAARRAKQAGFDIIYVYAGHRMTLTQHFLLPEFNDRIDEYGGSLENRSRLIRELLEETHEAVGDTCAVAFRFAVDEMMGAEGMQAQEEGRAVVEMLAEMPDLWDVNVSDWSNDSVATRYEPNDGYQTSYIEFVKQLTSKPVVAVGRLNSPDTMVSMVKRGVVDFIGAAHPSIADPFLPEKIRTGRVEEIGECIGCNICVSSDSLGIPIRCTQNPTMGEEWRRGWHPERIAPRGNQDAALVIGAAPAGLECAMQLARRGYQVTLAEASNALGGRVVREAQLLGLSAWRRVADYRIFDLQQRANVETFLDSRMSAADVIELGIPNVFIATGASWRHDGVGRSNRRPFIAGSSVDVLTPDDVMDAKLPTSGPLLVYDDDQTYLAGVLAERLAGTGLQLVFVTPASVVLPFTEFKPEQARVQRSLLERGVTLITGHKLVAAGNERCEIRCVYTDKPRNLACATLLPVTDRVRHCDLFARAASGLG